MSNEEKTAYEKFQDALTLWEAGEVPRKIFNWDNWDMNDFGDVQFSVMNSTTVVEKNDIKKYCRCSFPFLEDTVDAFVWYDEGIILCDGMKLRLVELFDCNSSVAIFERIEE